jgi:hypothetical protein
MGKKEEEIGVPGRASNAADLLFPTGEPFATSAQLNLSETISYRLE